MFRRDDDDMDELMRQFPPSTIFAPLPDEKAAALRFAMLRQESTPVEARRPADPTESWWCYDWQHDPLSAEDRRRAELVSTMVELCAFAREQDAIELVLEELECDLRAGHFDSADALLDLLDPELLAPGVTLAALTITSHGQVNRRAREDFLERSERALRSLLGPERAEALLAPRR